MNKKILIDVNVALDVIQNRGEDYSGSARVLSLCEENKVTGFLSAASFGILHYILAKEIGKKKGSGDTEKTKIFS